MCLDNPNTSEAKDEILQLTFCLSIASRWLLIPIGWLKKFRCIKYYTAIDCLVVMELFYDIIGQWYYFHFDFVGCHKLARCKGSSSAFYLLCCYVERTFYSRRIQSFCPSTLLFRKSINFNNKYDSFSIRVKTEINSSGAMKTLLPVVLIKSRKYTKFKTDEHSLYRIHGWLSILPTSHNLLKYYSRFFKYPLHSIKFAHTKYSARFFMCFSWCYP